MAALHIPGSGGPVHMGALSVNKVLDKIQLIYKVYAISQNFFANKILSCGHCMAHEKVTISQESSDILTCTNDTGRVYLTRLFISYITPALMWIGDGLYCHLPTAVISAQVALTGQGALRHWRGVSWHIWPSAHVTPSQADSLHWHVVQPCGSSRKPYMHFLGHDIIGHLCGRKYFNENTLQII